MGSAKIKTKNKKYITLVALIITVALILVIVVAINSIQTVTWTQNGTSVTNGTVTLEVGTIVTGYDAGVDSYNGGWAVLGAEKGELLIVSTSNIESNIQIGGNIGSDAGSGYVAGYSNGVEYLNTLCSVYGKGKNATGARSINADDINRVTGYDPTNQGDGTVFAAGTISQYNNEVTYKLGISESEYYFMEYSSNVKSGTSAGEIFIMPDGTELTLETTEGIKVTSNGYYYYPNTLTQNSSGYTKGIAKDSTAYTTLFSNTNPGSGAYWLATPYACANEGNAHFRTSRGIKRFGFYRNIVVGSGLLTIILMALFKGLVRVQLFL